MKLKDLLSLFSKKGIRIGFSTGKPFHPEFQERSDAIDDLTGKTKRLKNEEKKRKKNNR